MSASLYDSLWESSKAQMWDWKKALLWSYLLLQAVFLKGEWVV